MGNIEKAASFKTFKNNLLADIDPQTAELGLQVLDTYFPKKAEAIIPPSRRDRSQQSKKTELRLGIAAVETVGTEVDRLVRIGQTDQALVLAGFEQTLAARNMRHALEISAHGSRTKILDLKGEVGDLVLRTAMLNIFAVRDLSEISQGTKELSFWDSSTFITSFHQTSHTSMVMRITELYGDGGRNELEKAKVSANKIKPALYAVAESSSAS